MLGLEQICNTSKVCITANAQQQLEHVQYPQTMKRIDLQQICTTFWHVIVKTV